MKILYAIQGTGNGHLSRAMDIIPYISLSHQVTVLAEEAPRADYTDMVSKLILKIY